MSCGDDYIKTRRRLINALISEGILRDERVINALSNVPRDIFVPLEFKRHAYSDTPLPIGYGGTISAPHMVAMMDEALDLKGGLNVLEVGAGSGYHAATIAHIVAGHASSDSDGGHVFSIEMVPELVRFALRNLRAASYSGDVTVVLADGSKGFREEAPYDRVLVTAAAPDVPNSLLEQLREGGIMVVPVGLLHSFQSLMVVRKDVSGRLSIEDRGGCSFVPLVGEYGFDF